MPKKQPRNSFYFYMLDFKEEQRKKGINYSNMAEIAEAASPFWKDAPPSVRAKFDAIAKKEKEKTKTPLHKFTSTGIPLAEIEQQERELREAEEAERQDIKNLVKLKSFNKAIIWEDFYLMDVSTYCKTGSQYLIGEFAVLRFNIRDGIKEHYHENINPGHIPTGYASDVKLGSQEFGLDMPDEDPEKRSNYIQILAYIIDYLRQQNREDRPEGQHDMKTLPPIFTMPDKVAPVQDFILQMCNRAAEDDSIFRIYKLDTLLFTMINAIATSKHQGLPKESLALAHLKLDAFKYTPGIGCEHHETLDKSVECTKSRVTRWAYSMLDRLLPVAGIEPVVGRHLPFDYHIEGIHQYKEEKKVKTGPTVAASFSRIAGSSCSSTANNSFNDVAASISAPRPPRTHTPLRKPNTDFSKMIRSPPEITEESFPPLMAGRGRGLSSSLKNMNINK